MIAIVCGGRDYKNRARVHQVMNAAVDRLGLTAIIEGEAGKESEVADPETGELKMRVQEGADMLAREWARDRGDIGVIAVPVDWAGEPDKAKRRALGPARNSMMEAILLRDAGPKALFAFHPSGPGTANMLKIIGFHNRRLREDDPDYVRVIEIDKPKPDQPSQSDPA